jgi:predicted oxidoreductase
MNVQQRVTFLEQALELGITTVDHADIYGSELPFGTALATAPHLRSKFEIVTKCGIVPLNTPQTATSVPHYNTDRQYIIGSAEKSLQLMRVDQIDVLLIHRPDPLMDIDEVAEAFQTLRHSGKVQHFGVSNFTAGQFALLATSCELITNQIEFSPLHLDPLHDGTLDQCQQLAVVPMIWSALAGGRIFVDQSEPAVRVRAVLSELASQYQVAQTTLLYAWIMQHPSRPVVLTGSQRISAAREAVAASNLRLTREHWFAIWTAANGANVA